MVLVAASIIVSFCGSMEPRCDINCCDCCKVGALVEGGDAARWESRWVCRDPCNVNNWSLGSLTVGNVEGPAVLEDTPGRKY